MELFFQQNLWVIVLIVLWALPWKGVALWKASQNKHKTWFIVIFLVNTFAILEIVYIFYFSKSNLKVSEIRQNSLNQKENESKNSSKSRILAINRAARGRKKTRKEKVIEFARDRRNITNDDVQNLLKVSDATATRYLEEMEKDGIIQQKGKTGKGVYYTVKK